MQYCEDCKTILTEDTTGGKLLFRCPRCNNIYPATAEQTLVKFAAANKSKKDLYSDFINALNKSPESSIEHHVCEKCKHPYRAYGLIGPERAPVFACMKCDYITMYN